MVNSPGMAGRAPLLNTSERIFFEHKRAAVAVKLDHVRARVSGRCGHVYEKTVVYSLIVPAHPAIVKIALLYVLFVNAGREHKYPHAAVKGLGPLILIMPMPPSPRAVDMAAMVSII